MRVTFNNERDVPAGVFQKTMADEADKSSVRPKHDVKRAGEARSPRSYKRRCTVTLQPMPEEGEDKPRVEDSTQSQGDGNWVLGGWTRLQLAQGTECLGDQEPVGRCCRSRGRKQLPAGQDTAAAMEGAREAPVRLGSAAGQDTACIPCGRSLTRYPRGSALRLLLPQKPGRRSQHGSRHRQAFLGCI